MVENKKTDIDLTKDFIRDYELFSNEIKKVIVGQDEIIKQLLISIFCNGHCIIEGVPGLAKTLLVRTISKSLGLDFKRIQFTPDLCPLISLEQRFLMKIKILNSLKARYLEI